MCCPSFYSLSGKWALTSQFPLTREQRCTKNGHTGIKICEHASAGVSGHFRIYFRMKQMLINFNRMSMSFHSCPFKGGICSF